MKLMSSAAAERPNRSRELQQWGDEGEMKGRTEREDGKKRNRFKNKSSVDTDAHYLQVHSVTT